MTLSNGYSKVSADPDLDGVHVEDVLRLCGDGRFQRYMYLTVGLVMMADAMEITLLSFLAPCVAAEWGLSSFQQGALTASVFAGEFIGALLFGVLSDELGRKRAFLWCTLTVVGFGLLTCAAQNYWTLLLLRTMVGVGAGGLEVPFDLASEFMNSEVRGRQLILVQALWGVGSVYMVAASWVVLGVLGSGWRILSVAAAVPPALVLFTLVYIPESPRWLLVQGRGREAHQVLERVAAINGRSLPNFSLLKPEAPPSHVRVCDLLGPSLRRTSITMWVLWITFGFTYYGIILFISKLFESSTSELCAFDYGVILGSASAEVAFTLLAYLYVDRVGRKVSISASFLGAGLAALLLPLAGGHGWGWVWAVVGRGMAVTTSCLVWIVAPELYPTDIRSTGHAVSNALARFGAAGASFWVASSSTGSVAMGALLAVVNLGGAMAALAIPRETLKVDLDTVGEGRKLVPLAAQGDDSMVERLHGGMGEPPPTSRLQRVRVDI